MEQGVIWQKLRQRALDTTVVGTRIPIRSAPTLASWLRAGAFTVAAKTQNRFEISASTIEIGGALFSEAAFFLDHASEHSVTVRHQLVAGRWYSSAWLCVTMYYWAFFLALSLTRMIGRTGWFLNKENARRLAALATAGAGNPGAGPFVVECLAQTSTSQRDIVLRKASKSRMHDLAWQILFEEIGSLLMVGAKNGASAEELRVYHVLNESAKRLGSSWPSDLRSTINYGPGVAYGTVTRRTPTGVFGMIAVNQAASFEFLVDRLETNVAALLAREASAEPTTATKMLVDMTFIMDCLVRALHEEVIERCRLDRRWPNARAAFLTGEFEGYASPHWPVRSSA